MKCKIAVQSGAALEEPQDVLNPGLMRSELERDGPATLTSYPAARRQRRAQKSSSHRLKAHIAVRSINDHAVLRGQPLVKAVPLQLQLWDISLAADLQVRPGPLERPFGCERAVTVGTIFEDSLFPFASGFWPIICFAQARKG